MAAPYADVSIDTGAATIIGDYLNTSSGTGASITQNISNVAGLYTIGFTDSPPCEDPSQNSPFSGTYSSPPTTLPLVITWTNPTAGCVLHYTTDGSAPNADSPVYPSGGLSISTTTVIRVIAVQTGYANSDTIGGTWTIN
jgi:hypothetical protein